ncbi:MAG TPA: tRNA (adenosine(37)-N6)-threonylcarbamoyltransferase complex transferase subunit TsaD [Ktedonobacterales bacterium]
MPESVTPTRILAIESSCDETGAAIIDHGRIIRSNVVASQASIHARYGGVVPEVASRQQLSAIAPVIEDALAEANATWESIDAIAATYGPGLAGSLLVGLSAGKALAFARELPFIGVNHLEAHIYANWLRTTREGDGHAPIDRSEPWPGDPAFPLLALVISGAHSELVSIPHHGVYELLGQTLDDAAGEAFDKVARLLGLSYPGGPAIQAAASERDESVSNPYKLPRAWLRGTFDFSFSGLKTATLELIRSANRGQSEDSAARVRNIAAAFQESVVDVLATKTVRAAQRLGARQVVLAGGVAANLPLRERLDALLGRQDIALRYPPVALCTDNAAMIGAAAYFHALTGERSGLDLDVRPNLQLPFAHIAGPRAG